MNEGGCEPRSRSQSADLSERGKASEATNRRAAHSVASTDSLRGATPLTCTMYVTRRPEIGNVFPHLLPDPDSVSLSTCGEERASIGRAVVVVDGTYFDYAHTHARTNERQRRYCSRWGDEWTAGELGERGRGQNVCK